MYSFVTNHTSCRKTAILTHTHTHSVIRVDVLTVCDLVGFNVQYRPCFLSFLQDLVFTSTGSSLICHTDVVIHSRRSSTQTFRPCQPTQPPKFLLTVTPRVRNTQPFPSKTSKWTILIARTFTQFSGLK